MNIQYVMKAVKKYQAVKGNKEGKGDCIIWWLSMSRAK